MRSGTHALFKFFYGLNAANLAAYRSMAIERALTTARGVFHAYFYRVAYNKLVLEKAVLQNLG
jgi:hypothetical protein